MKKIYIIYYYQKRLLKKIQKIIKLSLMCIHEVNLIMQSKFKCKKRNTFEDILPYFIIVFTLSIRILFLVFYYSP